MLPKSIELITAITTIIANIAAVIALIPLMIAAITYCRGRLTKKTLKIADIRFGEKRQLRSNDPTQTRDVRIVFFNQSNHNFYIKSCFIALDNSSTLLAVFNETKEIGKQQYESIFNTLVPAHSPCIIEGTIFFEDNSTFHEHIELQVHLLDDQVFSFSIDTVSVFGTIQMKR